MMAARFIELPPLAERTPMELFGGVDGQGFDGCLWASTSARRGGMSRIARHDDREGDEHWVVEHTTQAETFGKFVAYVDPHTDEQRLACFHEGPKDRESWFAWRHLGDPTWRYEPVPWEGNAVGGRGLAADPTRKLIGVGGSDDWNSSKIGRAYMKNLDGSWTKVREVRPGLLWEAVFEGPGGAIVEFWSAWGTNIPAMTLRDGVRMPDLPGGQLSAAEWFRGHVYAAGGRPGTAHAPKMWRLEGGQWREVLNAVGLVSRLDHILAVPRTPPELWVVGKNPLGVGYSLDGVTWTPAVGVPRVQSGTGDANHQTALGYYGNRVWVMARDERAKHIRVFREDKPSTIVVAPPPPVPLVMESPPEEPVPNDVPTRGRRSRWARRS